MNRLHSAWAGSLSEGTLRTQDLLPKFMAALETADPEGELTVVLEYKALWGAASVLATYTTLPYANAEDVLEAIGFWDSQQVEYMLNERVFDLLNEVAPEGTYFGTSEGDGASFGFWYSDCEVCGLNLYEHSPEGQPCDEDDSDA